MENTCGGAFCGKVPDTQPAILSKKCTPLQISFNWSLGISGAPPSKQASEKNSSNFKIYCMLYCYSFSAIRASSFEWLTDGKSLIKTKLNCSIKSVYFRVRAMTEKEKHGNYRAKIHNQTYSRWYMKVNSEEQNTW